MDSNDEKSEYENWLNEFLGKNDGFSGTIHKVSGDTLVLLAAINIPRSVIAAIERIPYGKGMAGIAWKRAQPVTTCNLKEDTSGNIAPGAKAVDVRAGIALPVFDAGNVVRATVGIGYKTPREFSSQQLHCMLDEVSRLP